MMRRLLPDTLGGRIVLVLLVGLLGFHLGSLWLHQTGTEAVLGSTRESQLAERLATAKRAVAELPQADRDRMAHALSSIGLDLHWTPMATCISPMRRVRASKPSARGCWSWNPRLPIGVCV